jgi:PIN domain nuclease of toxin-antitoxin system
VIVLDTHALVWMDSNDASLGHGSRALIEEAWRVGEVVVSAISFWEIAMLLQRGRIALPVATEVWRADILQAGVVEVAVDGRIGLLAASLQSFHKDPADRFIVATALHNRATLITADRAILDWASDLKRQDARK